MRKKYTRKKRLSFLGKVTLILNLLTVIMLLVSYLSPFVDPRTFWPFAFFGLAYMPLLAVNVLFVLFWLFIRNRRTFALLSLMAILIGWQPLRAHIGLNKNRLTTQEQVENQTSDSLIAGTDLRVMTYNVHLFREFGQTKNEPDIKDQALELIRKADPDLICIQEYYTRKKGQHDISELFRNALGLKYQYIHSTAENEFESYGLAIFSKHPIVSSGHLPDFEQGVNSIIFADVEKEGRVFRVYNVHLRSYGFQQEDYDFIAGPIEESMEKRISSTKRIGNRLKKAFTLRSLQARSLRKHSEENTKPVLIMGDFNDTPLSFAVNHVGKGMQNTFQKKAWGWGQTYNGDFPNFQIDYVLASPDFQVLRYEIIREKLSDHYPVLVDLVL